MRTLKYGDTGSDVKTLQTALNRAGCSVNVDGIFGSGTASAVKTIQKKYGLLVDAIVGAKTWAVLPVVDASALGEAILECLDAVEKLPEFKKVMELISNA